MGIVDFIKEDVRKRRFKTNKKMEKDLAGKNGRFRKMLVTLTLKKILLGMTLIFLSKIRQTLQHWGYQLTKEEFHIRIK